MPATVESEHSINETILASAGDPVGLTLSIAPWPRSGPADSTAMSGIQSRVDSASQTLTLSITLPEPQSAPLSSLRRLTQAPLPILRKLDHGRATRTHSGIALHLDQVDAALNSWTDEGIPLHSLIAFDFAERGTPLGTRSIGLAALVG